MLSEHSGQSSTKELLSVTVVTVHSEVLDGTWWSRIKSCFYSQSSIFFGQKVNGITTQAPPWASFHSSRKSSAAAAATKLLQSCLTLCDPTEGSPPRSPVSGILQAWSLEWVAISFSNAWMEKWKWSRSVVSDSVRSHGLQPTNLLCPWDFPGKSTGVGCHRLLPENPLGRDYFYHHLISL